MNRILNNILVKPAGPDCNMACDYCFYLKKKEIFSGTPVHRMSLEVLEALMSDFMGQGAPELSVSWQGGEPTLMGLDFFRRAVELEIKYGAGKTAGNGFQTNGILIDREWARFFREHRFLTGLSIDGPERIHDRYRKFPNGSGTFSKVMEAAETLMDEGAEVNALTVINKYSACFPDEIYCFLRDSGFRHMQFIPCVESCTEFNAEPEDYGNFLCRVFDLWLSDFSGGVPLTSIRFFESMLFFYAGFPPAECTLLRECGTYLCVEHNGDVYSCDFFVEPGWRLGNVMESDISGLLNSGKQRTFGSQKLLLHNDCHSCRWLSLCRGGCLKDRNNRAAGGGLNHLCTAFKKFFEYSEPGFRRIVADWRAKNSGPSSDMSAVKTGRNDTCPCGSGLKFKKCCGRAL